MSARPDLHDLVERERLFVHGDRFEINRHRLQHIDIEYKFLKRCAKPGFEPTSGVHKNLSTGRHRGGQVGRSRYGLEDERGDSLGRRASLPPCVRRQRFDQLLDSGKGVGGAMAGCPLQGFHILR